MSVMTKDAQQAMTPTEAFHLLQQGNARFVHNQCMERDLCEQAKQTADGQAPFAVIVSCIDSRTSSELIFDLGLGDVFNVRIAGNIANDDILGSLEFACQLAGAKLIVVLGHSQCGAIKGACDKAELGHLTGLLHKIEPAVAAETTETHDRTSQNATFVEKVAEINVKQTLETIVTHSAVIKSLVDSKQCGIVGAMHDLASGRVHFYGAP